MRTRRKVRWGWGSRREPQYWRRDRPQESRRSARANRPGRGSVTSTPPYSGDVFIPCFPPPEESETREPRGTPSGVDARVASRGDREASRRSVRTELTSGRLTAELSPKPGAVCHLLRRSAPGCGLPPPRLALPAGTDVLGVRGVPSGCALRRSASSRRGNPLVVWTPYVTACRGSPGGWRRL